MPFSLLPKLKDEIDRLLKLQVNERGDDISEWVCPTVVVR